MQVKNLKQPIYLFPFTAEAALIHHILKAHGINTAGFLDNKKSLHSESYDGIPFLSLENAAEENPGASVVICGYRYYMLQNELMNIGFSNISCMDRIIQGCNNIKEHIKEINAAFLDKNAPRQVARLNRLSVEICAEILPKDITAISLIINVVELPITSRCTLKCNYCGDLIHYYKKQENRILEQIFSDIDYLMEKADFIRTLIVIGGEPLIHPQLLEILEYIGKYRGRYGIVKIVTNGTIIPSENIISSIESNKVFVKISDYGSLSVNIQRLSELLEEKLIQYQIEKVSWRDMHRIVDNDSRNAQEKFNVCYSRTTCNAVMNGRLYICEFLNHAEDLKGIPFDNQNSISLIDENVSKDDIKEYLKSHVAKPGCHYCSGHDTELPEVPVAEQIKEPLPYKAFDNYPSEYVNTH